MLCTHERIKKTERRDESASITGLCSREEYGYICTVESIGEKPVTEEEIVQTFGSIQYVQGLLTQGNMVEVRVALERAEGRLKWSTQKGESVSVTSGANCDLLIVTKERKPYELILK